MFLKIKQDWESLNQRTCEKHSKVIGDMNFLWVNQLKRWEKRNRSNIPDDEWCGRKKIKSNIIVHLLHVCNCTKHHMNLSFKAPHRSLRQNHFYFSFTYGNTGLEVSGNLPKHIHRTVWSLDLNLQGRMLELIFFLLCYMN